MSIVDYSKAVKDTFYEQFREEKSMDEEYFGQVYIGAKEIFCDGIYVKSEQHPCGWDFISFEHLECSDDIENMPIELEDISGDIYHFHDYEGLTVKEIIEKVGLKGWCFEISGVENLE